MSRTKRVDTKSGLRLIEQHQALVKHFETVSDGPVPVIDGLTELPGFKSLLSTFVSASKFSRNSGQEWNPFNQRMLVRSPSGGLGPGDIFEGINASAISAAELAHEIMHVALLESFFSGYETFRNKEEFVRFSLAAEAVCFWYGELAAQKLNVYYPNSGRVFSRYRGLATSQFSPAEALRIEGVNSEWESLDIYAQAFSGQRSMLLETTSEPGKALCNLLYAFYNNNHRSSAMFFRVLKSTEILGSYFDRFCRPYRNVSLLPKHTDLIARFSQSTKSVGSLMPSVLRDLKNANSDCIAQIKNRRRIQTRAYFAYSQLAIYQNQCVVGVVGKKVTSVSKRASKAAIDQIQIYLEQLESFKALDHKGFLVQLGETDRNFERVMRQFKTHIVTNRIRVDRPHSPSNLVGLILPNAIIDAKRLRFMLDSIESDEFSMGQREPKIRQRERAHVAFHGHQFLDEHIQQARRKSKRSGSDLSSLAIAVNALLVERNHFDFVCPAVQSPSGESYRECLFVYK